jgi:hypothetical protein
MASISPAAQTCGLQMDILISSHQINKYRASLSYSASHTSQAAPVRSTDLSNCVSLITGPRYCGSAVRQMTTGRGPLLTRYHGLGSRLAKDRSAICRLASAVTQQGLCQGHSFHLLRQGIHLLARSRETISSPKIKSVYTKNVHMAEEHLYGPVNRSRRVGARRRASSESSSYESGTMTTISNYGTISSLRGPKMKTNRSYVAVDDAFAETAGTDEQDSETDLAMARNLNRKMDIALLPFLSSLYLFNGLDRSNVGNAETQGMPRT